MTKEEQIQLESHRALNKESIPDNNNIAFEKGFCLGAKWVDKQMVELWNVARNVYEAWMGGTMNDVRECMKDLGHVFDEFKDKGMKGGKE